MKTNKKHRPLPGKHCINLYFDQNNEDAGCFILGSYEAFKPMLIAAAMENPTFGRAFLDAALEYADLLVERERKEANHDIPSIIPCRFRHRFRRMLRGLLPS